MVQLINLTEQTIYEVITGASIEPSGTVARINTNTTIVDYINGIPIYAGKCTAITGLPDPQPNTTYIVSALVLDNIPKDRLDVVRIGNVHKVDGQIIGCRGFRRNYKR